MADQFDTFVRELPHDIRGWESATDVDVFDWLCWLDSHGKGTKVVHSPNCLAVGDTATSNCSLGDSCPRRYAAQSLDKGFVSKLKRAFSEILGKTEPWDNKEKRGNPADSDIVRGYLSCSRVEQRRVGVIVNQARPLLAPVLTRLVAYMRTSAPVLPTVGERLARMRDVALFIVAFHTMQRGFDLSCALASQVLRLPNGAGLIFNFHLRKTLRASSHSVVAKRDPSSDICPVRAIGEFSMVARSVGWEMGTGYLFPEIALTALGQRAN